MEIPELMIDEQVNGMINNYARRIESQGISFKDYMEVTGMGIEKLAEQMRPAAIKNIETRLVLEAVVQAENLEASDEAIEEQFNKMAESYRMEKDEIKKMYEGERLEQMKQDLAVQEAIDFLVAEAKLAD